MMMTIFVTLVDNDFTLQAGTYVINYSAPANRVEAHNVSLYDYTDSQYVNIGTVNYTLDNASNTSYGNYSVTLTEPHTYAVTHTTEVAKANSGLGNLNPVTDGIFTTVDIQKVGTGGGSGDSIWTKDGVIATYEGVVRADRNGNKINLNPDMSNGGTKAIIDSTLPMHFEVNGNEAMNIDTNGRVNAKNGLNITNLPEAGTPANLYISPAGTVHKSTATTYTAEEVDKKLAIKDKLIEKLISKIRCTRKEG